MVISPRSSRSWNLYIKRHNLFKTLRFINSTSSSPLDNTPRFYYHTKSLKSARLVLTQMRHIGWLNKSHNNATWTKCVRKIAKKSNISWRLAICIENCWIHCNQTFRIYLIHKLMEISPSSWFSTIHEMVRNMFLIRYWPSILRSKTFK